MSSPATQFDKFTSGSHGAKNAVGFSRKDILNRTFTNAQTLFNFTKTKSAFEQQVNGTAGKCRCTRTLSVKGVAVYLPVYDKPSGNAAEFALIYAASDLPNEMDASKGCSLLSLGSTILAAIDHVTEHLTPKELDAWGSLNDIIQSAIAEDDQKHHPERLAEVAAAEKELQEFNVWMAERRRRAYEAPLTLAERDRFDKDTLEIWHVYETEFGEERDPGGYLSKASERWAAKMAEEAGFGSVEE